jgi:hypothetical protein
MSPPPQSLSILSTVIVLQNVCLDGSRSGYGVFGLNVYISACRPGIVGCALSIGVDINLLS